jgi:hypothetical protein
MPFISAPTVGRVPGTGLPVRALTRWTRARGPSGRLGARPTGVVHQLTCRDDRRRRVRRSVVHRSGSTAARRGPHRAVERLSPLLVTVWTVPVRQGRAAEQLAAPAAGGGADVCPGHGQPLELMSRNRLAQRGAVPVFEVDGTVPGLLADPPGHREGSAAGTDARGVPLVEGHGRDDGGTHHRSTHFASAVWRRRGPERPGSAGDRSGGPLGGLSPL